MNWSLLIKTNNLKCPYYLYSDFFKYRVLNDQIWSRSDHFLKKIMIRSGSQKKDRPVLWKKDNKFSINFKGCENGSNTCTIWIRLRYCQSVSLFIQSSFWQIWYEIWSQIMLQFWSRFTGMFLYIIWYRLFVHDFFFSWEKIKSE